MPKSKKQQISTDYDKARALWYEKLKKSGFVDIEQDEDNLKAWSYRIVGNERKHTVIYKQQYYYLANHFLNSHKFDTKLEETIWAYHVEGISARNISKLLAKVKIKLSKTQVWERIKKHNAIMRAAYINKEESDEQI